MKNNNFKIQFKEVLKISIVPLLLMIVAQFGHLSLARQTIFESKSQLFEIIIVNPLNIYLFPLICSMTIAILLQIKKRNNSMVYEYFRRGRKSYFRDIFISACIVNLFIIIVGNLMSCLITNIIFSKNSGLFEPGVTDTISMLSNIRTSSVLTMLFYIVQQWFVSIVILGFSFVVNLATDNLFLGFFASTIYLIVSEATYFIIDTNLLDITLVPAYLPGIKLRPFPENILQLELGLMPLILITLLIYFKNKEKIEEV